MLLHVLKPVAFGLDFTVGQSRTRHSEVSIWTKRPEENAHVTKEWDDKCNKTNSEDETSTRSPLVRSPQPIVLPDGMWERISRKAFELWQERGYRDGRDLEDWLDAEATVMEEIHEALE